MILGIGVDSVDIKRFESWSSYNPPLLRRIFSEQEIAYCLQNPSKSAERFAVRFAAREAFFKAYSMYQPEHAIPFLTLCRLITIEKKSNDAPNLLVDWVKVAAHRSNTFIPPTTSIDILLSLTHTQQTATAFVILTRARNLLSFVIASEQSERGNPAL